MKKTATVFREFLCKMFNSFLRHNYVPKKMLHCELSPRMKDSTVRKTKLENYRPVMSSALLMKVFEYTLLPLLTDYLCTCVQEI